jgi:hypothetical protein
VIALVAFFAFGATMSALTTILLLFPGTPVDIAWRMNPRAKDQLAHLGIWALLLMVAVSAACLTAAIGLGRRRPFGFWTALLSLVLNMIGDMPNAIIAHDRRTLIGVPIAIVLLIYLAINRRTFSV